MTGIVFGLAAATCWGISALLVRLGLQYIRPSTGTWISLIPGCFLITGLAAVFNIGSFMELPMIAIFWFALGGLFNFALGRFLNTNSIHMVGLAKATPLFSTAPLFATLLAIIVLGEKITPWLVLGTVTIVIGIILITSEERH